MKLNAYMEKLGFYRYKLIYSILSKTRPNTNHLSE